MNDPSALPAIEASIKYVVPGEKAIFYPSDRARSYWPGEEHRVRIENMRAVADTLSLEKNGFVLLTHRSNVKNFSDPEEVRNVYFAEMVELATRLLGAEKVLVFGEVIRSDGTETNEGRLPAYGAHVDYGDFTVRRFAEEILGKDEAAQWLERYRYVLMNIWRPLRTVERTPLAVCDASSVLESDLNESEVRGGLNDPNRPSLFGFNLSYSPRHRWYYAPRMRPDEVLAFKLFDSDRSRVQWTGHTAFDDPMTPADAPPRLSIEVRTISFIRP